MRPQRLRIMPESTCWMQRNDPSRLVRSTASQSAAFIRTASPSRVTPALLTSTSMRPCSLIARPIASLMESARRKIEIDGAHRARRAQRFQRCRTFHRPRGGDHRIACLREGKRDGVSDAAARAGD